MRRTTTTLLALGLTITAAVGCSTQVADLDDLDVDEDACDPRGTAALGTDLDLQMKGMVPHINQDIFIAITQTERREIQSMAVLASLEDPDLRVLIPNFLPEGPSELAFWADMPPDGFNAIDDETTDHQWTRPVCPNGKMVFNHTTPFQDVEGAIAVRSVFELVLPPALGKRSLLREFTMWVRATELDVDDLDKEAQTRAFYRWAPFVALPRQDEPPAQVFPLRDGRYVFEVSKTLGETRGAIDQGNFYNIEFVIDVDDSGDLSGDDFVCRYEAEQAPNRNVWSFEPSMDGCDPGDLNPAEFPADDRDDG